MKILEQGDVLLFQEDVPKDATFDAKEYILAHGESTGHAHRLEFDEFTKRPSDKYKVLRKDNVLYLEVFNAVPLRHEEHKEIMIPPGNYRIGRVREKGMFDDMINPVVD